LSGFATYQAVAPNRDKFLANSQLDDKASLVPQHVIVVRVASFAFRFESVERFRECIKYYEKKERPR